MLLSIVLAALFCLPFVSPTAHRSKDAHSAATTQAVALRRRIESTPRLSAKEHILSFTLPRGQELGMISWLAYDSKARLLWILQRGTKAEPVLAIDQSGTVIHSFGNGMFVTPHAIRLDPERNVWTVDAGSSKVIKFSPNGQKLLEFVVAGGTSNNSFGGATDIAFGPNGRVFVSDGYKNARVVEYTARGAKVRQWGTRGSRVGQFNLPHSIVIDSKGIVYVADRENGRIEKFTLNGTFIGEIPHLGRTYALALGANNTLWATMQPLDEPPGSPGWIVKLDRATGKVLGYVPVSAHGGLHSVECDDADQPMTDLGNTVVGFETVRGPNVGGARGEPL